MTTRRWVKIRRHDQASGTGERFWCQVLSETRDGRLVVPVDNMTLGLGLPRPDDVLTLGVDEKILDELSA
jgi:hypothetical protein